MNLTTSLISGTTSSSRKTINEAASGKVWRILRAISRHSSAKLIGCLIFCLVSCQKNTSDLAISPTSDPSSDPSMKTVSSAADLSGILVEYSILPRSTDPAISSHFEHHWASTREGSVNLKNTLVIFLPGSYRKPVDYKAFIRKSVTLGYHAIGIMYPNSQPVNNFCSATNDITCHRRARHEIVDGVDRHPNINVNFTNSIVNRITKMIKFMHNAKSAQKWGQFLVNGQPAWDKIIISGHSQGGQNAGVLGKYYPIKKVIMFAAIDFHNNKRMPDWQDLPANKPKYFSLFNTKDELLPYADAQAAWQHLGMTIYGGLVNVDTGAPPYGNTHTLITTANPVVDLSPKYHNSTAMDACTPKDASGKFLYDKAWEYMLTK